MPLDDVIVLGAGASYVHGAPLTDQILPYALSGSPRRDDPRLDLLRRFLNDVFHFAAPDRALDIGSIGANGEFARAWKGVPGLVDVLSVVDVALDRKESLARSYDIEKLRAVRAALEFAIFDALENSLRRVSRRSRATHELVRRLDPGRAAVISFNYDVIADIALARRADKAFRFEQAHVERLAESNGHITLDYGVEFANVPPHQRPAPRFQLLKLHGSFNWFRSRVTGNLYFGGLQKAVRVLFRSRADEVASKAVENLWRFYNATPAPGLEQLEDLEAVLITPTHLKDLRNAHLARIWRRAEECLREARRITFIGYSLPGDDLHVKYLFKRALETRAPGAPEASIVVVNHGEGARENYERFFGRRLKRYHPEGFEAWVQSAAAPPLRAAHSAARSRVARRPAKRRRPASTRR